MRPPKKNILLISITLLLISSCTRIGVFEKDVAIPGHAWSAAFKPVIDFEVTDTASLYNIFVVIRHTNAYRYNNIWLNIYTLFPGDTARKQQRFELPLATDDKGWLGSGMDDIYEQRVSITKDRPVKFPRPGIYHFKLENVMREDPLQYVMNVGIRVEKVR